LNFFAVTETFKVSPSAIATGLAVDNLLGLLYFPLVSSLGGPYDESSKVESPHLHVESRGTGSTGTAEEKTNIETLTVAAAAESSSSNSPEGMEEVEKLTSALALAFTIASLSDYASSRTGLPSVPISTLLTVILATAAPSQLKQLIPSGELLGKLSLLFFFASVGNASGTVSSTFAATGAASLVAFELILYAVHLAVILGIGGSVLNIPMPDLLLASNANIGNAATASSLASAKGWRSRILPAILVGTLGNAFGTFAGLTLGSFVLRKIAGY
jgi:uncharacterized membrane protein